MGLPRLLTLVPPDPELGPAVGRWMAGVPSAAPSEIGAPPWPSVEAALVGNLGRVRPDLRPSDLPSLRFAQHLFTGVDEFPFDRFRPDVVVAGNVGAFAPYVAEHAVAMVLALSKRLLPRHRQVLEGRLRPISSSDALEGARVLILGFGEIGHEVARRLKPFGVTIVGLSRRAPPDAEADVVVPSASLDVELELAHVVVNCLPWTRETTGMIGAPQLDRMSEDVIFVNVGRARTVDERAFWEHMERFPAARVGLDVWWEEDFDSGIVGDGPRIARYPNMIGSPHSAGFTPRTRQRAFDRALENLARFFRGEPPRYIVDRSDLPVVASPK